MSRLGSLLEEPTAAGATKEGLKMKLNGRGQKWAVKRNRLDDQREQWKPDVLLNSSVTWANQLLSCLSCPVFSVLYKMSLEWIQTLMEMNP